MLQNDKKKFSLCTLGWECLKAFYNCKFVITSADYIQHGDVVKHSKRVTMKMSWLSHENECYETFVPM